MSWGGSERVPGWEHLPLVATAPEGLLHPGHPALGSATPPMSSEGEGVALGSQGPLRGSHLLHSPVMGLVWDTQGPGDQGTEEGSWTLRWGQRYRKGKPRGKGSEMGFWVLWRVGTGWKGLLNSGAGVGDSPSSPHLSPSVGPAEALSSGCTIILRMQKASEPRSGLWQGGRCLFTTHMAEALTNQNGLETPFCARY